MSGTPQHPQHPQQPGQHQGQQQPAYQASSNLPPQGGQQSQLPPPQPGQQQSGYPAGPPQPGQPGYRPPSEGRPAAPRDEKAEAQQRDAMAAASIGAQIILDFNRDGSRGARGGAGGTIVENTMARDAYLVGLGLDPAAPSGPPPSPEVLAKRRQREEEAAKEATEGPLQSPKATKVSSLAADIDDSPPESGPGGEGTPRGGSGAHAPPGGSGAHAGA